MTTDAQPTVRYETRDRKAYLTLDRPDRLNAIDFRMPGELAAAVGAPTGTPGCTSSCCKAPGGPSVPDMT